MASNDVRDIMDVGPSGDARPAKKQKVAASRNKDQYAGMSKEVRGLMMGDGVPPVQVQENRYKTKPKIAKRAQPWIREPFTNSARTDGLVLTHWIRGGNLARPDTPGGTGAPVTPAESKTENDGDTSKAPPALQSNYHFAKYNTKPSGPEYTDEEYEKHLKSENWSKEETDYLMQLALGFDLRWVVIWDRYDYHPSETSGEGDSMVVAAAPRQRSMEEIKARYYEVSAEVMTIHHPLSSMSTAEFDLHQKMKKFDPNREATRKRLAEALLARSPDELREEEVLLGELKRITDNEDRFLEERKELYQRLDHPQSHGSIAMYESSAGLINLMQSLLQSDKNKKRRSITGPEANSSPAQNGPTQTPTSAHPSHRGSISQTNKKGSTSQGIQPRKLSQRDEIRFGISHHDRLTPGVAFRQGRIEKLVLAKSAAQQQKLHDALGHLSIPVRAVMPTMKVCAEYYKLVAAVHTLLDARKVSEKIHNEIRVLKASKELRERKERATEDGHSQNGDKEQPEDTKMEDDTERVDEEDKSEMKEASDNEEEQNEEDEDPDNEDDDEDQQDEDAEGDNDNDGLEEADGETEEVEVEAEEDAEAEVDGENDEDVEQDGDDLDDEDGEEEVGEEEEEEVDEDVDEDAEEPEADDEPSVKASSHKRSASVLSMGSEKSTKKTRR